MDKAKLSGIFFILVGSALLTAIFLGATSGLLPLAAVFVTLGLRRLKT